MGDDQFQLGSGSWWDTSRNRSSFDSGTANPPVSISTTLNTIASFGSTASSVAGHDQSPADVDGGGLDDQNLQMMGLGLSSQNLDWNQALLGEKAEGGFRSLLQEDYNQQKLYSGGPSEEQINRPSFSLDQTAAYSSQASSNDDGSITASGFQVDFHAMLLSENQPATYQNRSPMNYQYPSGGGGGGYGAAEFVPSANKYLQFSRAARPPAAAAPSGSPLHFTNNTPFWNASATAAAAVDNHPRSSFFPAGLQTQQHQIPPHPHPSFDDKPKTSEYRDVNTKKNSSETSSNKRTRGNETPNPLPAFKARKEKMGDRITALQQLVSPFGKTDTASVLSEAIAYIKFLHEQVSVLSNPYMKNGAPTSQHHQIMSSNTDKSKDPEGAPRQDLRSRGLCLVPVSSTFPMTHETTVDFWTPTFGGTFR